MREEIRRTLSVAAMLIVGAITLPAAVQIECSFANLKGEPLRDVEVRLRAEGAAAQTPPEEDLYGKTRSEGRLSFSNLTPGTYLLEAQRKGYVALTLKIAIPADQPLRRVLLTEKEFRNLEKKANSALNQGDHEAAVQELTQLIGYYPRDAVLHDNLARSYASLHQEEKALAAAALAAELDSARTPVIAHVRGIILRDAGEKALKQRDFKTAASKFEALKALNADSVEAWHGLALAYGHMRMFKEAIEAIDQAIRLKPASEDLVLIKKALEANAGVQ